MDQRKSDRWDGRSKGRTREDGLWIKFTLRCAWYSSPFRGFELRFRPSRPRVPRIPNGVCAYSRPQVTELSENISCAECGREVDGFSAIAEKWGYWSGGVGVVVPSCPECARREFAPDAPASRRVRSGSRRG